MGRWAGPQVVMGAEADHCAHDGAPCLHLCRRDHDLRCHRLTEVTSLRDPELVNHPLHYGGDVPYECIKVIEAWGLGFHLGNTVKYIARAGEKEPVEALVDLKKARWYLDREIARREGRVEDG